MEYLINKLPQTWEDRIIPLMTLNDTFVLGGSLALHILKVINYNFKERTPDLDFSLTEPFEEQKFLTLIDFFNLSVVRGVNDYGDDGHPIYNLNPKTVLEKELIMLEYSGNIVKAIEENKLDEYQEKYYRVDFFNNNFLKRKDWFELDYFGTTIKITHPSVILSAKMKYATDNRVGKQHKHFQDIKSIDWKEYFKIVKRIQATHTAVENKYILDKYVFNQETIQDYSDNDDLPF
jgi:hypothetical protein